MYTKFAEIGQSLIDCGVFDWMINIKTFSIVDPKLTGHEEREARNLIQDMPDRSYGTL
jgi:hypothetical protein